MEKLKASNLRMSMEGLGGGAGGSGSGGYSGPGPFLTQTEEMEVRTIDAAPTRWTGFPLLGSQDVKSRLDVGQKSEMWGTIHVIWFRYITCSVELVMAIWHTPP